MNTDIDLSSLDNFDLSPEWESEQKKVRSTPKDKNLKSKKRPNRRKQKGELKNLKSSKSFFSFAITPNLEILQTLKEKIKLTGITYSIKEIASVITDRKERLNIKIIVNEPDKTLWKCKSSGKIYSSKKNAVHQAVYSKEISIIESKTLEQQKPIGNFSYVLECPFTKTLLPPTSLHYFEEIIQHHIFENKIEKPYDDYITALQKVSEEDKLTDWKENPINRYSYFIKGYPEVEFQTLANVENALENKYFKEFFIGVKSFSLSAANLEILEPNIQTEVKRFFSMEHLWSKDFFVSIVINLKRSKFCVFKNEKGSFVRFGSRKKIQDSPTKELTSQILLDLSNASMLAKKSLIKTLRKKDYKLEEIVLELRWLVKEGYLNEYSNGMLETN